MTQSVSIVAAAPTNRLRRRATDGPGEVSRFDDLELDRVTREVRRAGRLIALTPTEFRLLEAFLTNPRRVLTRSQLFLAVWEFDFGPLSNLLNVYVGYLRRKLGEPRLIHTERGIGYVLRRPH